MTISAESQADWEKDCLRWWGRILTGKKSHWCYDWDCLPVDETTDEINCCTCFDDQEVSAADEKSAAKT